MPSGPRRLTIEYRLSGGYRLIANCGPFILGEVVAL